MAAKKGGKYLIWRTESYEENGSVMKK